jgi:pyrophosphatase PpaX
MLLVVLVQFLDTDFKKIKLIIFDLDGTIANTNELILKTFQKVLKVDLKTIKKNMGPPSKTMLRNMFPNITDKKMILINKIWEREYKIQLCKENLLDLDTIKTLKFLNEKYSLGIITSSTKKIANITLKENYCLFDFVICAEDSKTHKPNPEILLNIIEKYKLKNYNVVYIGDNIYDIRFGKNAKVKTIGKIDVLYNKKDLEKEKPDLIIKKISDLKCLF